jgi:hypothetical protein
VPHLAFQPNELTNIEILPMAEVTTSYYLRMNVSDQPGVLADLTRILADATFRSMPCCRRNRPTAKPVPTSSS